MLLTLSAEIFNGFLKEQDILKSSLLVASSGKRLPNLTTQYFQAVCSLVQ